MKSFQTLKHGIITLVVISVVACSKDEIITVDEQSYKIENPDYEIIRMMGYHTEGIVEKQDLYVVEGDMLIYKAHIDSLRHTPATRQARYNNVITNGRENGIRVKISSNNVPDPDWRNAVYDAIDIWNAVPNCSVHFHAITQQLFYHHVKVEMSTLTEVAAANVPNNGKPGERIHINPNIAYYNTSHEQKVNILVHEFGHILGLAHTDYVSNYSGDPENRSYDNPENINHISGTPETEYASVMYSHSAGRDAGNASN
jgi:hypothetical protein